VNNFETQKNSSYFEQFFLEGNDIAPGRNGSGEWMLKGGLNVGVKRSNKEIESQRSYLGSCWTFLVLTAFQIDDKRHWPALHGLPSPLKHQYKTP